MSKERRPRKSTNPSICWHRARGLGMKELFSSQVGNIRGKTTRHSGLDHLGRSKK